MQHTIVIQEWEESERGWGQRPDGASLHLTEADRNAYVEAYWAAERARGLTEAPDEYSRPCGRPRLVVATEELYRRVVESGLGLRLWERAYREAVG